MQSARLFLLNESKPHPSYVENHRGRASETAQGDRCLLPSLLTTNTHSYTDTFQVNQKIKPQVGTIPLSGMSLCLSSVLHYILCITDTTENPQTPVPHFPPKGPVTLDDLRLSDSQITNTE